MPVCDHLKNIYTKKKWQVFPVFLFYLYFKYQQKSQLIKGVWFAVVCDLLNTIYSSANLNSVEFTEINRINHSYIFLFKFSFSSIYKFQNFILLEVLILKTVFFALIYDPVRKISSLYIYQQTIREYRAQSTVS